MRNLRWRNRLLLCFFCRLATKLPPRGLLDRTPVPAPSYAVAPVLARRRQARRRRRGQAGRRNPKETTGAQSCAMPITTPNGQLCNLHIRGPRAMVGGGSSLVVVLGERRQAAGPTRRAAPHRRKSSGVGAVVVHVGRRSLAAAHVSSHVEIRARRDARSSSARRRAPDGRSPGAFVPKESARRGGRESDRRRSRARARSRGRRRARRGPRVSSDCCRRGPARSSAS